MLYTRWELLSRRLVFWTNHLENQDLFQQAMLSYSDQKINLWQLDEFSRRSRHSNLKIMEANPTEKFAFIKRLPVRIRAIHFPLKSVFVLSGYFSVRKGLYGIYRLVYKTSK